MNKIQHQNLYFIFIFLFFLLMQFNNCNSIHSQKGDFTSASANLATGSPASSGENTPVNAANPYVLQCIKSSDGAVVSPSLKKTVLDASGGTVTGKISSLDWAQDEDLTVTLQNNCLAENNYTDPMLQYIAVNLIRHDMPFTVYVIKKESVSNLKSFIDTALKSECLVSAEKNQNMKINAAAADVNFNDQKHLNAIGATQIFIDSILNYNSGQLYKTKVAVIDTGVDVNNPDLIDQIAKDSIGKMLGYNSTGLTSDFTDLDFHGTHVTGLIAAGYHNGILGSGVWGRNIAVYPIRTFQIDANNELTAKSSDVANAIIWATTRNVELINLSLGSATESLAIKNAISFAISKNVTIVVAAGNDRKKIDSVNPQYPAMFSTQFNGLITVGSLDVATNGLSTFSNYSSSYVDLLAPGSNAELGIYSTLPLRYKASGFGAKVTDASGTYPVHGTSMAAPIVTGALAAAISISKARGVKFTNAELETFLTGEGSPKLAAYSTYAFRGNYLNFPVLMKFINAKIEATLAAAAVSIAPTAFTITLQPANKQAVISENIEINIQATSSTTLTYQWYYNDQPLAGATQSKLGFNQIQENQAGSYWVEVTNGNSTVTSRVAEVKVALKYCE